MPQSTTPPDPTSRSTTVELTVDGIPFTITLYRTATYGQARVQAGAVVHVFGGLSLSLAPGAGL